MSLVQALERRRGSQAASTSGAAACHEGGSDVEGQYHVILDNVYVQYDLYSTAVW